MLKLGITTLQQLETSHESSTRVIGAQLLLALNALDPGPRAPLRKRILRSLLLPNTTGKTTWPGRFEAVDREVSGILKAERGAGLSCLDLGVSDGSTALDLFRRLADVEGLSYLMSDLNENVFIRRGGVCIDVCDDEGNPIQMTLGPFVVPLIQLSHLHPLQLVNRSLFAFGRLRGARIRRAFAARDGFERVSILSPEVQTALAEEPRLRFERLDLFALPAAQFDFVRIFNVLNLGDGEFGFSLALARRGLESIAAAVREGGHLLVGRSVGTPDGGLRTDATLLRKSGAGLDVSRQFGEGSELEGLLPVESPVSAT